MLHCFIVIYLFHISSDLCWCKVNENRTQKTRDLFCKMVHKVESEMQSGAEQVRILVNRVADRHYRDKQWNGVV